MTAKEYLRQYRKLTERIRQLDMSIEKIEAELQGTSGSGGDGTPRGTAISDPTGRFAVELADMKQRRVRLREEAWRKRDEIEAVIREVDDPVCSRLLYDRYILCMQWEEIAEDIHHDPMYTRARLHGRALQKASQCITERW